MVYAIRYCTAERLNDKQAKPHTGGHCRTESLQSRAAQGYMRLVVLNGEDVWIVPFPNAEVLAGGRSRPPSLHKSLFLPIDIIEKRAIWQAKIEYEIPWFWLF